MADEDPVQEALAGNPEDDPSAAQAKQTVRRDPPDIDVGPHFPSGMSAPEAAMAGATAGMSDEDKEKVSKLAEQHGIQTDAQLVAAGSADDEEEDETP